MLRQMLDFEVGHRSPPPTPPAAVPPADAKASGAWSAPAAMDDLPCPAGARRMTARTLLRRRRQRRRRSPPPVCRQVRVVRARSLRCRQALQASRRCGCIKFPAAASPLLQLPCCIRCLFHTVLPSMQACRWPPPRPPQPPALPRPPRSPRWGHTPRTGTRGLCSWLSSSTSSTCAWQACWPASTATGCIPSKSCATTPKTFRAWWVLPLPCRLPPAACSVASHAAVLQHVGAKLCAAERSSWGPLITGAAAGL